VAPGKDGFPGKYAKGKIGLELFDLRAEIGERTNVAEANPDVVKRLQDLAKTMDDEIQRNKRPPGRRPGAVPEKIVAKPLQPKPIAADAHGAFVCPALHARLANPDGARYVESQYRKNIGNWHSLDLVVSWQLQDLPAGRYRVVVRQALEHPLAGGEFVVSVGDAKVQGNVKTTPSWRECVDVDAGIVAVPKPGTQTVSIQGTKLSSGRCVMNLNCLRLVPVR
jgi:hypothetical protein